MMPLPYQEVTARDREYTHEKTSIPKFHGGYGDPGSLKGQLERPQLLIQNGQPVYLYVATGVNPNQGFGSSSHVFKVKVEE